MSSHINFFLHMVMINSKPTVWRAINPVKPPSAGRLYKAIFPMMTPTMKNNTTSARSRALGPSSFPAAANAGTGLLLCTVFRIRSPSSSYGSKCTFQRQPNRPGAAVKRPASQGALVSRPEPHGVGRPPQFSKGEVNPTEKALA